MIYLIKMVLRLAVLPGAQFENLWLEFSLSLTKYKIFDALYTIIVSTLRAEFRPLRHPLPNYKGILLRGYPK